MFDKEYNRPDELTVPEELHVPREFHEAPDPFTVGPFSVPLPEEFPSDEKEPEKGPEPAEGIEGVNRRKNNLMQMMYLAALMTSLAASASVYSAQKHFDMNSFIRTHRDWVDEYGNDYLYLGDDHWGYIAGPDNGGMVFSRFRMNTKQEDEYSCMNYSIEWDWDTWSEKKNEGVVRFVEEGGNYTIEVYDPRQPDLRRRFKYVEPGKVNYAEKEEMREVLGMSLQDLINKYNTYYLEHVPPVYDNYRKIVFNPDGTGTAFIGNKEIPLTYSFNGDIADVSFKVNVGGEQIKALLLFDAGKGLVGLKLLSKDGSRTFAPFVAG